MRVEKNPLHGLDACRLFNKDAVLECLLATKHDRFVDGQVRVG